MKAYREKLKIQCMVFSIVCVILAVFSAFGFLAEAGIVSVAPAVGNSHYQSMWRGFCSGASFGILVLMVIGLVKSFLALRSEEKLKKYYVKEHDERMAHVITFAQATALRVFLLLGLAAAIVGGYFSIPVGLTILGCVLFVSLTTAIFKLYYSKKF